jgi:molecular chaperone HtpG
MIENSPYVEAFKSRGEEVLLLTDPVDEYLAASLTSYKEKPLKAADRGDAAEAPVDEEIKKRFGKLLESLKEKIGDVKDVRLSGRLKESAACLVGDEGAMGAHMERLLQRMGRGEEVPHAKRILELNPDHPAVRMLQKTWDRNPADPKVQTLGRLLYDQAVIAEGSKIQDPAGFARRLNDLIVSSESVQ